MLGGITVSQIIVFVINFQYHFINKIYTQIWVLLSKCVRIINTIPRLLKVNKNKGQPSLVAQLVKNPPAMHETWFWPLGQEDPLEKEMATHSCILAWRIHGQRSLVGYSPWGHKELDTTEQLTQQQEQQQLLFEPRLHGNCLWCI